MVKISEALDKANYGGSQQFIEIQQKSSLTPASEKFTEQHRLAKRLSGKWDERLFKAVNDDSYLPEVFKTLRSRILHPLDGEMVPKTIMITSAIPKEGKSFVSANLAISLAHGMDQHSLLVDCDLRKPALARMFGLDNSVGLVDYLRDNVMLSELIAKTPINTLSVLTSGKSPANPAELLGSTRMSALVEELSGRYDDRIIIFDSPPLLVAAESSVLAGQVDAVILVVRQSTSGKAHIQKLIDIIGTERIMGIVFNDQSINSLQKSLVKGYGHYHEGYYQ
jgi:exopolysaccharide/PEP-CTERM locus tyrosine autokinase